MDRLERLLQKSMESQSCSAPLGTSKNTTDETTSLLEQTAEQNADTSLQNELDPTKAEVQTHLAETEVPADSSGLQLEPTKTEEEAHDKLELPAGKISPPAITSRPEVKVDAQNEVKLDTESKWTPKPDMTELVEENKPQKIGSTTLTSISITKEPNEDKEETSSSVIIESPQNESVKEKQDVEKEESEEVVSEKDDKEHVIEYLASEIHRLETLMLSAARPSSSELKEQTAEPSKSAEPTTTPPTPISSKAPQISKVTSSHSPSSSKVTITISSQSYNTGFLDGLPTRNPLGKLNHSQTIQPDEMANALESTIPNVVSNIFTNIQNMTEGTGEVDLLSAPLSTKKEEASLTSIDGSKVSISGNSSTEIAAEGERLFQQWIEHQLKNLHLTAAMAGYIRKNAMNLFRRIASQYMERVGKMGGSLEDNMRKATQVALNNTQTLTAAILKNYVDFAGGLMQIIGEQVSRVGKQLDSTGDSISHMSLNPFDIVSNVIDSLPNPSDYSKYFRAFGKQLMGEASDSGQANNGSHSSEAGSAPTPQATSEHEVKQAGLLKKTMGALTKTIGWFG